MNVLKWLDKTIARLEGWLIIAFLWLIVILTFIQVCLRVLYTHGHFQWANAFMGHLDWSEPFVRLLVLWLAFIGASLLTRENKHIKIDLFSAILPLKFHSVRDLILSVACILISAIMVKVCIGYVKMEMEYGGTILSHLPNWIGQLILPLGFALILFRFLIKVFDQSLNIYREITK